jgi:hypothetical protein
MMNLCVSVCVFGYILGTLITKDKILHFSNYNVQIYEGESNENRKKFFKFNLLNESGTQLYHFST